MPGGASRRSIAHFGVSQRVPLRNSFRPSRRQSRQTGPVYRAMSLDDFCTDAEFVIADDR